MTHSTTEQVIAEIVQWQQNGFMQPLKLTLDSEEITSFQSLQRIFAALLVAQAIFKGRWLGYGTVKLKFSRK